MIFKHALKVVEPRHSCRLFSSVGTKVVGNETWDSTSRFRPNSAQNGRSFTDNDLEMLNTVRGIEKEEKSPARSPPSHSEDKLKRIVDDNRRKDFERFQPRRWREGDVYAPHDLSPEESTKFKNQRKVDIDVFDALAINPLHEYKNFSIMWEFMSSMGRIKHRKETGLRPVNQRRIAKAIRRAVGMGLMPSVHKHPEMLEAEAMTRR